MIEPIRSSEIIDMNFKETVMATTINKLVEQSNSEIELAEKITSILGDITEKIKMMDNAIRELIIWSNKTK
jgi:hypothetical protein